MAIFCFDGMLPPANFKVKIISMNHKFIEKDISYGNYRLKIRLADFSDSGEGGLEVELLEKEVSNYKFCQGFL